jgi:hypothetical protein
MEAQEFYGNTALVVPQHEESAGALVEVEQQREVAETQASLAIAKRFPRNQIKALDRILSACSRPTLAEVATYQYSRGGTDITGPSIRLAEALAQNWGNLSFGIRELEQKNGWSTIEAFAWDMETNTRQVKIFQVKHERYTRRGKYALEDPRDIYEMTANQGARRLRACILGIIPGDIVEAAVDQCEKTLRTKAEVTPERIAALIEKFWAYGVTKKQIEQRIQRRIEAITPAMLVSLGKVYNSLKDGMSTPADWFDDVSPEGGDKPKSGTEGLKAKLRDQPPKDNPAPTEPEAPPFDPTPAPDGQNTAQAASSPSEGSDTPPEEEITPEQAFRNEWINLRSSGFYNYVKENHERFSTSPPDLVHEAMEKWKKLYPDKAIPLCLGGTGVKSEALVPTEPPEPDDGSQPDPPTQKDWRTDDQVWEAMLKDAEETLGHSLFTKAIYEFKLERHLTKSPNPVFMRGADRELMAKKLNEALNAAV